MATARLPLALTAIESATTHRVDRNPSLPRSLPYKRRRTVDIDSGVRPEPVLQRLAEVAAMREQLAGGTWRDAQAIAEIAGFDVAIIHAFIDKNRAKLGNAFQASRMQKRLGGGDRLVEHFSPQFVAWAVESLQVAWQRHQQRTATEQ